jgi:hypothetical protein
MHNIREQVGSVVAEDTQSSVAALDTAVLTQSRMCASVIEAAADSKLPIDSTQKLLESLTEGLKNLVVGRADLASAIRELNLIQAKSNLRATGFGCPNGVKIITGVKEANSVACDG